MNLSIRDARLLTLFLLCVAIVAGTNVAFGQATAAISGRIQDPSGAAIPEATVTVTNTETGAVRSITTDAGGSYRALSLQVGRYEVKAEKTGFKTASQSGLNLAVGQEGVVNISMEVGAVTEQVTVTGEAPIVNTTTSSVAGLVGEKEVKELPLNGRSFDQLILLNAGAVNYTSLKVSSGSGTPQGNRFSVAGRRPSENYFTLNGVELTGPNQDQTIPWGVSGQLLGVDGIREFNVLSDAYGAEFGKKAGAQVTLVTQSGTNQLHGTAFEFLRNNHLDARDFFDPGKIPPFKRNQFGGSAGGPIIKDKTFVFGNYEGLRYRLGLSSVAQVPDNFARQGMLPCVATPPPPPPPATAPAPPLLACPANVAVGTPITVPDLQPGMLPYLRAWWPAPNRPNLTVNGLPTGIAEASSSPLESIREEYGTARVDHTFSGKDTLSGYYTIDDGFKISPLVDPVFTNTISLRYQVASLQETHVFSPSVINVFTAGYSHVVYNFTPSAEDSFPASVSLIAGKPPGLITVGAGGGGGGAAGQLSPAGGTSANFVDYHKSLFTYQDQVQVIKGSHQISFGAWLQWQRDNGTGTSNNLGRADFGSLTAFLQGTVATLRSVPREITHQWRQRVTSWFVQDSIQLRPNLTLRVGLRHEATNGWNDPSGRASNFIFQNGVVQTEPKVGKSALTENNAKWLFSPRIGLAWDPRGNGKTSIRAAVGQHYDLQDDQIIVATNPPFNTSPTFLNQPFLASVPFNPNVAFPPLCGPGAPASPACLLYTPRGFEPAFKTPAAVEWNFSIEQQLTSNMSLRLAYVGSEGYHNIVVKDPNTIAPLVCSNAAGCVSGGLNRVSATNTLGNGLAPQGTTYVPIATGRPNPFVANGSFYWNYEGTTSYNALQVEVKQRFNSGLQFKGNYTWSKLLDQGSGEGTGQGVNTTNIMTPYNVGFNRGPSPHDFAHQASISGSYELPVGQGKPWVSGASGVGGKLISGWQLNWIISMTSGYPLIPTVGANVSGNGDTTNPDRPSWNPAFTGKVITGTATEWFNPRAFMVPQSGTWGNVSVGAIRAPGASTLDMSLFKNTTLTEKLKLQFRAEFFNVLNHTNLGFPNTAVFSGGQLTANPTINPSAGRITFATTKSRQIQFGMKLNF